MEKIQQNLNEAIKQLEANIEKIRLRLNARKTMALVISKRRYTLPTLTVNVQLFDVNDEIKYLASRLIRSLPVYTIKAVLSLNKVSRTFGCTYEYGYEARKIMIGGLVNSQNGSQQSGLIASTSN